MKLMLDGDVLALRPIPWKSSVISTLLKLNELPKIVLRMMIGPEW